MRKIIIAVALLVSGLAVGQTTVTLEDQCNCEVLSGPDVTTPGMTTPAGADLGDVYVNTNTGTIYFWDGDSWELTSSDDQQIQQFNFNALTNELTLTLENGGSVTTSISAISGDGNLNSPDSTIDIGGDINALLGDVSIDVADDAIINSKLADDAVQTENILNGTILTEDISSGGNNQVLVTDATGTVAWVSRDSFESIADQVTITGIGTAADPFKVEDLSIVTAKLGPDAVTNAKLADDAVRTENILNGTIINEDLADGSVDTNKILDGTILTGDISSGGNNQVLVTDATGTVAWVSRDSFESIADQVTITGIGTAADPFKVEDLSIVTAKLGPDAVTNAKLADDAVQTENILNGTILTEDISSGGNNQVLVTDATGTVAWVSRDSFESIADQVTITGIGTAADPFKVEDLSIVTAKLGPDAVTNAKLADDAVQTENILNGTILTEDISSGGNNQVLVTDATGTVAWVSRDSFESIADQVTITGIGTAADPFKVEDLSIVTAKLGPDAVTNAKLAD
ncbi:hypothetical protein, partial [Maribacter sp. 2307UL18-2]|uniref:hypothetical protein n=1 Tax=Maribacter sp. 2307UL18-2 TaxID=3386274 RepID=UPI0039BCEA2B